MILKKEQLLIKMLITESIINLGSFLDIIFHRKISIFVVLTANPLLCVVKELEGLLTPWCCLLF